MLVQTKKLAKAAFHAIPLDRIPHAFADRNPETRTFEVIGSQDYRVVFRVAPAAIAKCKLKITPVSNALFLAKPELTSEGAADASLRGLRGILLVLSLTYPSHAFRRPVAFSPLPFCG
jgi:hypothetical protein